MEPRLRVSTNRPNVARWGAKPVLLEDHQLNPVGPRAPRRRDRHALTLNDSNRTPEADYAPRKFDILQSFARSILYRSYPMGNTRGQRGRTHQHSGRRKY